MTATNPLRAVIWAAVSTVEQAERDSVTQQIADARAFCERRGWPVVAVLEVPGHSREYGLYSDAEAVMPAYRELRERCEARALDVLVCRGRDRLGRHAALIATVEYYVVNVAGASVYSMAMPTEPGGSHDHWMAALEGAKAQDEMRELRRRVVAGMTAKVRRGFPGGSFAPYGYRRVIDLTPADVDAVEDIAGKDPLDLVIHYAEATEVRWLFARYLTGAVGFVGLARELNQRNTGHTWTSEGLRYVLQNDTYIGRVAYGVNLGIPNNKATIVRAAGRHTPIIDEATFEQTRALRATRAAHRRAVGSRHLFSGIVKCGLCGRPFLSRLDRHGTIYYRCANRVVTAGAPCSAPWISERALRQIVQEQLIAPLAADSSAYAAWYQAQTQRVDASEVAAIQRGISDASKALTFWDRQAERGAVSESEWEQNRRRIIGERAALESRLAALQDAAARAMTLPTRADFQAVRGNPPDDILRAFLLRFVKVTITGREVAIDCG